MEVAEFSKQKYKSDITKVNLVFSVFLEWTRYDSVQICIIACPVPPKKQKN